MKNLRLLIIPAILILLCFVAANKAFAREICNDGFLKDSWCPCPDKNGDGEADPEYASVCGIIRSANIEGAPSTYDEDVTISTYGHPVSGVTVGIYECNENYPSCFPYGNIGGSDPADRRKIGECVTSENEGKFHCYMKRVSPNSKAYIVITCGKGDPYIEEIPSTKSLVNLSYEVDCQGEYNGEEQPSTIEIADRSKELSCTIDEADPKVGVEADAGVREVTTFSANTGVEGGDIRFTSFGGMQFLMGYHPGAYWDEDCKVMYDKNRAKGVSPGNLLDAEWDIFGGKYDSVEQKCNPSGEMALIAPFMYGIPESSKMVTHRTFEGRFAVSREMQNPRAIQQYNSVTFSGCAEKVALRFRGEDYQEDPMSCDEILDCKSSLGGNKNMYTTASWGAKGAQSYESQDMIDNEERDPTDIYCRDGNYGDVTFGQVQPIYPDDTCTPGEDGCKYVLSSDYLLPDVLPKGGVTQDRGTSTINDTYSTPYRTDTWNLYDSEAQNPHKVGHTAIYADDSVHKVNSGVASLRIATDDINPDIDNHGVIANRYVNTVNAVDRDYSYSSDVYIKTIGKDLKTLCSLSSVNGVGDRTVTPDNEDSFLSHFSFVGLSDDIKNEVGGTYTYATPDAVKRDELLNKGGLSAIAIDYFDTLQRIAIDDEGRFDESKLKEEAGFFGEYGFLNFIKNYGGENIRKSFAERINADAWDYDKQSVVNTSYCISKENFKQYFPAYGEADYPGGAGSCYPWNDIDKGEYCNVHPGPSNPNIPIDGNLRTCKVERCIKEWKEEFVCTEYDCAYGEVDPITGIFECYIEGDTCTNGYYDYTPVPCDEGDERNCLYRQLDNYTDTYEQSLNATKPYCDLWRAGTMAIDGDIMKDHAARAVQEPLYPYLKQQINMDPIADTANYMAQAFTPATEDSTYYQNAKVIDYNFTASQDPVEDATHRLTSGHLVKGLGSSGASYKLRKYISVTPYTTVFTDDFPPFKWSDDCENPAKDSWCDPVPAPEDIDLDEIDGGACKPHITGSCPLLGHGVGVLAQNIVGAAGENAGGVPGSLLLAIIANEQEWLYSYRLDTRPNGEEYKTFLPNLMGWDDESIASYSEPYSARIPNCETNTFTAAGPYGFTTYDTWNAFGSMVRMGGYHPSRGANIDAVGEDDEDFYKDLFKIVSQCNFIDASYAAAANFKNEGMSCNTRLTEAQVRQALASWWGPMYSPSAIRQDIVDIALHCQ